MLSSKCVVNLLFTVVSRVFARVVSSDIGRYELVSLLSLFGFGMGATVAFPLFGDDAFPHVWLYSWVRFVLMLSVIRLSIWYGILSPPGTVLFFLFLWCVLLLYEGGGWESLLSCKLRVTIFRVVLVLFGLFCLCLFQIVLLLRLPSLSQ